MDRMVVLLTASIMAIAGIFTLWGANLIRRTLPPENTTGEVCHAALFRFYSGNYEKDTKKLILILENQRSVELRLENLYLIYGENVKTFPLNERLEGNMLKSLVVNGVDDGFTSGTVKTNCPEVSLYFKYSQLT